MAPLVAAVCWSFSIIVIGCYAQKRDRQNRDAAAAAVVFFRRW